MPYKDKAVRNAKARAKRATPEADASRAYHREYQRQLRAENLEEMRKYQREWARNNRRKLRGDKPRYYKAPWKTSEEKLTTKRANRRLFYSRHKAKIKAAAKEERLRNPEKHREYEVMRWQRDFEKRSHNNRVNRARRGGDCYVTLEEWLEVLRRHNFRCVYCGIVLTKQNRSMDHKIPLIRGGNNEIENLVPACFKCNVRKSRMTYDEFMSYRADSKAVKIQPDVQANRYKRRGAGCG